MNGILVTVGLLGSLVTSFLVPSIQAALQIKSLFSLDPSFDVNLYSLTGKALAADDQTLQVINDWRTSKGLPALPGETIPPMVSGTAVAMPIMVMGPAPDAPAASPAGS